MRHSGRLPLLVLLTACSCKDCNPPSPAEEEVCLDPSRQTPQGGVCDDLCPPGRRVSWRPAGTACEDFGQWTASRPNEGSFELLEWWQIATFEVPDLDLLDDVLVEILPGILADVAEAEPGTELGSVLEAFADQMIVLEPADQAAIEELVEDALATAVDLDPANVCVHVWAGAGEPVGFPPDTEPDCIVAGEAPALPELQNDLADAFESSIGIPGLAVMRTVAGTPEPVMIAVVDTAPRGLTGDDAVHGRAVASVIRQVACASLPPASCTVTVDTFLGLPRVLDPTGNPELNLGGGYFGFQGDLTRGIQEALTEWMRTADPGTPLVVNLSVGWEPSCGASRPQVVEPIVARAVERGALVLAASGNRRLGSCIAGPVAPAAWTDLVHAVTPVDGELGDLVTFRPGSNARLAAHGFMAVTSSGTTTDGPGSGSSFAAAVASGVAGLVWTYQPELTATELMDTLWDSGEARGEVQADFYRGNVPAPTQRVVTACRALATAIGMLDTSPMRCQEPLRPDVRGLWGDAPPLGSDVIELSIEEAPTRRVSCPWCSGTELDTRVFGLPAVPSLPDPWVVPQPPNPACRMCGIQVETSTSEPSGTARLIRDPYYDDMELVSTTLMLWDAGGNARVVQYDASVVPLEPDTVYEIASPDLVDIDGSGSKPVRGYATLVFMRGSQQLSAGNEIPIWED